LETCFACSPFSGTFKAGGGNRRGVFRLRRAGGRLDSFPPRRLWCFPFWLGFTNGFTYPTLLGGSDGTRDSFWPR
jgi:hypothetical protein